MGSNTKLIKKFEEALTKSLKEQYKAPSSQARSWFKNKINFLKPNIVELFKKTIQKHPNLTQQQDKAIIDAIIKSSIDKSKKILSQETYKKQRTISRASLENKTQSEFLRLLKPNITKSIAKTLKQKPKKLTSIENKTKKSKQRNISKLKKTPKEKNKRTSSTQINVKQHEAGRSLKTKTKKALRKPPQENLTTSLSKLRRRIEDIKTTDKSRHTTLVQKKSSLSKKSKKSKLSKHDIKRASKRVSQKNTKTTNLQNKKRISDREKLASIKKSTKKPQTEKTILKAPSNKKNKQILSQQTYKKQDIMEKERWDRLDKGLTGKERWDPSDKRLTGKESWDVSDKNPTTIKLSEKKHKKNRHKISTYDKNKSSTPPIDQTKSEITKKFKQELKNLHKQQKKNWLQENEQAQSWFKNKTKYVNRFILKCFEKTIAKMDDDFLKLHGPIVIDNIIKSLDQNKQYKSSLSQDTYNYQKNSDDLRRLTYAECKELSLSKNKMQKIFQEAQNKPVTVFANRNPKKKTIIWRGMYNHAKNKISEPNAEKSTIESQLSEYFLDKAPPNVNEKINSNLETAIADRTLKEVAPKISNNKTKYTYNKGSLIQKKNSRGEITLHPENGFFGIVEIARSGGNGSKDIIEFKNNQATAVILGTEGKSRIAATNIFSFKLQAAEYISNRPSKKKPKKKYVETPAISYSKQLKIPAISSSKQSKRRPYIGF